MAISMRKRLSTGETQPWTAKEVLQGKPLGHPSHPMLVHFPVAFYIGTLGLDILSKVGGFPAAPPATTWLLIGAFAATSLAVLTGLVDRSTVRAGSQTRGLTCSCSSLRPVCSSSTSSSGGPTGTWPRPSCCGSSWT